MPMKAILGLTLQEISLHTLQGHFPTEAERLIGEEKAIKFGESVLGRELLNYLPVHSCDRGCDSIELSVAELFAAKRPLNPHALNMFAQRFSYYVRRAEGEMLQLMQDNGWNVKDYLEAWISEFFRLGIEVLHGELPAEELLGNGYARDTWQRLEEFLAESRSVGA
jgi:hypothetical protein